ncbi:MAG TPA: phosphatidate cytidylyltransferase [Candidatus Binatus sp.]|uniref:phosphatidate cytidylyltransferase n=1 Tax=Candidatus Binatus sp. TaxID=2811406 RepID=UPI002B491C65|nr:phosphatidate cytidylyltransferase [Candidatus Binatus sp.]HKN13768.1 phosphatidate cytidylyltransferase [Candidatus Binatus sp.]
MLRARLLTAAVLLPAVGALVLFAPAWFFTIFNAVAGIWGLYEVAAMTGALHWVAVPLFAVVGGVPLFGLLYGGDLGLVGWLVPVLVILMMLGLAVRIELAGGGERFRGPRLVFMGAAYVGFLFPFFALLRNAPGGIEMLLLVILLVVVSDSGAYFVGRYLGRTKLAPSLSPHKTIEGAVGGLIATIVGGWLLFKMKGGTWDTSRILLFAAMISILAQLGDLAGSALKRGAGIKDSGWIFPGHGGLLDRTCSLVFAVFFTYYWFR